jgi:hypothetical protein
VTASCFATCRYHAQFSHVPYSIIFTSHGYLSVPLPVQGPVSLRIIDESFWKGLCRISRASLDTWLTGPKPRRGRPRLQRIDEARRTVFAARRDGGPLCAMLRAIGVDVDVEQLEAFAAFEMKQVAALTLGPELAEEEQQRRIRAFDAAAWHAARRRAGIWRLLAEALHLDDTERLLLATDNGGQGRTEPRALLVRHSLRPLTLSEPTVVIDADLDPLILGVCLPGLKTYRIEVAPQAQILQLADRTLSNAFLLSQAKTVIATLLYIVTAKRPDAFLLGSDCTPEGELRGRDIIEYCLFSCGLADADESLDWFSREPAERTACARFLWNLYSTENLGSYQVPVEHHPIETPLLAGLHAFLDRQTEDGVWSIGQTVDIAVLFEMWWSCGGHGRSPSAAACRAGTAHGCAPCWWPSRSRRRRRAARSRDRAARRTRRAAGSGRPDGPARPRGRSFFPRDPTALEEPRQCGPWRWRSHVPPAGRRARPASGRASPRSPPSPRRRAPRSAASGYRRPEPSAQSCPSCAAQRPSE